MFLLLNLPYLAMAVLPVWGAIGLVVYFAYSRSHSSMGRGIVEVVDDIEGDETMVPIKPDWGWLCMAASDPNCGHYTLTHSVI